MSYSWIGSIPGIDGFAHETRAPALRDSIALLVFGKMPAVLTQEDYEYQVKTAYERADTWLKIRG